MALDILKSVVASKLQSDIAESTDSSILRRKIAQQEFDLKEEESKLRAIAQDKEKEVLRMLFEAQTKPIPEDLNEHEKSLLQIAPELAPAINFAREIQKNPELLKYAKYYSPVTAEALNNVLSVISPGLSPNSPLSAKIKAEQEIKVLDKKEDIVKFQEQARNERKNKDVLRTKISAFARVAVSNISFIKEKLRGKTSLLLQKFRNDELSQEDKIKLLEKSPEIIESIQEMLNAGAGLFRNTEQRKKFDEALKNMNNLVNEDGTVNVENYLKLIGHIAEDNIFEKLENVQNEPEEEVNELISKFAESLSTLDFKKNFSVDNKNTDTNNTKLNDKNTISDEFKNTLIIDADGDMETNLRTLKNSLEQLKVPFSKLRAQIGKDESSGEYVLAFNDKSGSGKRLFFVFKSQEDAKKFLLFVQRKMSGS
jgi:hypothetical protein